MSDHESLYASREGVTNSREAMTLAIDWAEGRRSWTNLGSPYSTPPGYTLDVIAVMDAQEVVKWAAIAQALAVIEAQGAY